MSSLKADIALAKARDAEVMQVFRQYDVDGTDSIDMEELTALLDDLGLLADLQTSPVDFAVKMFTAFDADDNGILSFEEFKGVYNAAKVRSPRARLQPPASAPRRRSPRTALRVSTTGTDSDVRY